MNIDFTDEVVIVTGAARGIGKAAAEAFAESGAKVIIGDIDAKKGKKAADSINGEATFIKLDVSSSKSVVDLVKKVNEMYRRIDILVNNAGVFYTENIVDTPEEEWDKLMNINLRGAYLCSHYIIPEMLKRQSGVVINIASEAGLVGIGGQVAYNVSKAGIISMTKSMAVDFADNGIRVNAVCPGTTETPLFLNALKKADDPEELRSTYEKIRPLNRLGKPEEIAGAILAMASKNLAYATGSVLTIDGGYTAQ
ncbi:MAG: SDR family oxidoreductase [Halanaerobiales bacterium]|nr:SDR family oxidoreductase [Halanaerobiales bacterium]